MRETEQSPSDHRVIAVRGGSGRATSGVVAEFGSVRVDDSPVPQTLAQVSIVGDLDGDAAAAIASPFLEFVNDADRIVVDLSGIELIDSAGLRVLERLARNLPVEFIDPSIIVRRVLDTIPGPSISASTPG